MQPVCSLTSELDKQTSNSQLPLFESVSNQGEAVIHNKLKTDSDKLVELNWAAPAYSLL